MNATLAVLTIGMVPVNHVLPLLTDDIPEKNITYLSLFGSLSPEEVMTEYATEPGEEPAVVQLSEDTFVAISRPKVERALQAIVQVLDNQGIDVILLMNASPFRQLDVRHAVVLEPGRIVPPLIAAIVAGHQVGILIPVPGVLKSQEKKWHGLEKPPLYAVADLSGGDENGLIVAGRKLLAQGGDVLLLDCMGFHQRHRDLLQKALNVPVLLTYSLVARLASELLV